MRHLPLLLLACLLTTACDHSAAGPSSDAAPHSGAAPASGPVKEGTLQLLTFNRLQGFGGAIPCDPDSLAVLPAAAELRDRLAAEGDTALLVALGDSINRSYKVPHSKAGEISARTASRRALEALVAAKVNVYVPSHGDLLTGFEQLLGACRDQGLTVLISNLSAPGQPALKSSLVVDVGTLKVGLLSVIPVRIGDADDAMDEHGLKNNPIVPAYPGATLLPIKETLEKYVAELREQQGVDIVVAFSSVSQKANGKLANIPGLDVIIGSTETTMTADTVVIDGATALVSCLPAGREVAHTTIAIRNGNLGMVDLSPLHTLPGQIESAQARLDEYAERFGTTDPPTLARLVSENDPQAFLNMVSLLDENRVALEVHRNWKDSYIDQRAAELQPPAPGNPVLAALEGEGAAIDAALASAKLKPPVPPEGKPLIPHPEDCRPCHAEQYDFWEGTAHARSFASLQALQHAHDVSCLECHAAGFEVPSGWVDPRFDAPFGGVTCFQCHDAYAPHSSTPRQVVDPQFVHSDPLAMRCYECHVDRRSPGFDKDLLLPEVACPPMRDDEPALLLARQKALDSIRSRRAKGTADARDDYLEGRALVGLGQFEEGYVVLERFALANPDDVAIRVQTARLFEQSGNSAGAAKLLQEYLQRKSGDPVINLEYVTLLLAARDPGVRNAEAALAHLNLLLPDDPSESNRANLDFRVLQIDALFATNRVAEGLALINELSREHAADPRLKQRIDQYLGR